MGTTPTQADIEKQNAAKKAMEFIKDGMLLGLGSGSTFGYMLEALAKKVREEGFKVEGVPSSEKTRTLAESYGIPLVSFERGMILDLTIDGADEVDEHWAMIKGGGGALLREKINARFSRQVLIAVDSSKLVRRLGRFPLPVEVVPHGLAPVTEEIERLGAGVRQRMAGDAPYITDNGNYILDCAFGQIDEPASLDATLKAIPGVVESGLFIDLLDILVVGRADGAEVTTTQRQGAAQGR